MLSSAYSNPVLYSRASGRRDMTMRYISSLNHLIAVDDINWDISGFMALICPSFSFVKEKFLLKSDCIAIIYPSPFSETERWYHL